MYKIWELRADETKTHENNKLYSAGVGSVFKFTQFDLYSFAFEKISYESFHYFHSFPGENHSHSYSVSFNLFFRQISVLKKRELISITWFRLKNVSSLMFVLCNHSSTVIDKETLSRPVARKGAGVAIPPPPSRASPEKLSNGMRGGKEVNFFSFAPLKKIGDCPPNMLLCQQPCM